MRKERNINFPETTYFSRELARSGFLSFFLVLFVNQTNGRFLDMYGFAKACSGMSEGALDCYMLAKHVTHAPMPADLDQDVSRMWLVWHVSSYPLMLLNVSSATLMLLKSLDTSV